ncbi:MAG: hypothetical protein U0X20_00690 [Caldilineaceae bacterium]
MSTTDNSMAPTVVPFDHFAWRGDTWYAVDQMGDERGKGEIQFEAVLSFISSFGSADWMQPIQRRAPYRVERGLAPRGTGSHRTTRYTNGWFKSDRTTPYVQEYKAAAMVEPRNIRRTFLRVAALLNLCPGDEIHRFALFSPVLAYFRPATIQTLQSVLNGASRYLVNTGSMEGRYTLTCEGQEAAHACPKCGIEADLALRISDVFVFARLHQGREICARVDPLNRSITVTVDGSGQGGTETLLMLRSDGIRGLKAEESTTGVLDWIIRGDYTWERDARY